MEVCGWVGGLGRGRRREEGGVVVVVWEGGRCEERGDEGGGEGRVYCFCHP